MRLTIALEDNTYGKVLASIDMEDIVKMTVTDDIEKSNFNPQMLKSCTYTSYQCGHKQGRVDAFVEIIKKIKSRKAYLEEFYPNDSISISEANTYLEIAEQLKEQE